MQYEAANRALFQRLWRVIHGVKLIPHYGASLALISLFGLVCAPLWAQDPERHLFFLHNRFLEVYDLNEAHPQYGVAEYPQILQRFREAGLIVHSELRHGDINARNYAEKIATEIRTLMDQGVPAERITVVGTSKGGYIAQYVATLMMQPTMNFVFIGSFQESDLAAIPAIQFCGRILNIYERSDPLGNSARSRAAAASCNMEHYRDLELNNGLQHGFLFRALDEWLQPTIAWAQGQGGADSG